LQILGTCAAGGARRRLPRHEHQTTTSPAASTSPVSRHTTPPARQRQETPHIPCSTPTRHPRSAPSPTPGLGPPAPSSGIFCAPSRSTTNPLKSSTGGVMCVWRSYMHPQILPFGNHNSLRAQRSQASAPPPLQRARALRSVAECPRRVFVGPFHTAIANPPAQNKPMASVLTSTLSHCKSWPSADEADGPAPDRVRYTARSSRSGRRPLPAVSPGYAQRTKIP
jgi:hypothetical protein